MICGAIQTGNHFLWAMLAHVDCQAQSIGAYGYAGLAGPGSPAEAVLIAALTLFVALFGLRLMYGDIPHGSDLVGALLKIGIVLTIATSWPAWRAVGYETVLHAPSEIAASIATSAAQPASTANLARRLDAADQAIVKLTAVGTGRLTGGLVSGGTAEERLAGIALADETGLSWGRVVFLTGTIGPLALVWLSAGILLALAPLMAALLLFVGTRDLFFGWLRALFACALGALVLALCYGAELAVLERWLADALAQRRANVLTAAVPTELLVIALVFALVAAGALVLVIRLTFFAAPLWDRLERRGSETARGWRRAERRATGVAGQAYSETGRIDRIADAVAATVRREERAPDARRAAIRPVAGAAAPGSPAPAGAARPYADGLGSTYRRRHRRASAAASRRDTRS